MTVLFYVYGGRSLLQMKREEGFCGGLWMREEEQRNRRRERERERERERVCDFWSMENILLGFCYWKLCIGFFLEIYWINFLRVFGPNHDNILFFIFFCKLSSFFFSTIILFWFWRIIFIHYYLFLGEESSFFGEDIYSLLCNKCILLFVNFLLN
jgi:hypothetical protein